MRMLVWVSVLFASFTASAQYIPNRYIVELSGQPAAVTSGLSARRATMAEIGNRRAQVRARQQAMRAAIQQTSATILDSTDTLTSTFIVQADSSQAAAIAALPGVVSVHPERTFKPLLDQAAIIHHADQAWARVGKENAGAGVKIAIIDSGIDQSHPGFQDSSMTIPSGYPLGNNATDVNYTNSKVIVARSYASYFEYRDPDTTPRDHVGHGTALAMCAAGVQHAAPLATISGMAPKAWLGSYKVFGTPGVNDSAPESAILKALDDAAADGMDIINLSLGSDLAPSLDQDIEVTAIEHAASLGILVVVAAGNAGPGPQTLGSPASAPSAISVGASNNDRTFSTSVTLPDGTAYISLPGSGNVSSAQLSGPLVDVAGIDNQGGVACAALPAGSLTGKVALIQRGTCYFYDKLTYAQAAGAVGAVVYSTESDPDAISMYVDTATLPAQMVSYSDGIDIKNRLAAAGGSLNITMSFTTQAVKINPYQLTSFSSMGPNVDGSIKPEIVAVGSSVYTATQSLDMYGDMYDPSGYIVVDGTSFSTPIVAGALAVIKAAHPGLTVRDYRSLLINGAAQLTPGSNSDPQQAGAGLMDMNASVSSTTSLYPATLSFGVAGHGGQASMNLAISNFGTTGESYTASIEPRSGDAASPALSSTSLDVNPSGTAQLGVDLGSGTAPGSYEGFLVLRGAQSGTTLRVPYWYAVPTAAKTIQVISEPGAVRVGSTSTESLLVRVLDASGVSLIDTPPNVSITGGGTLLKTERRDDIGAGIYNLQIQWPATPGNNVVTIQEDDASTQVTVAVANRGPFGG